jgi:hypothetical protein
MKNAPFTAAEETQVREMGTLAPCLGPKFDRDDPLQVIQRLMTIQERYEATLDAIRAK